MTPREVALALHGHRQAEKARWARALRISQAMGDDMTVDKLFGGGQKQMDRERYENLKAFFDDGSS